ncbi:MAG: murein biosynthesis integral membrane protein MurJ [Anaerolineae bacterium]|nr:murein biosynthesis integral membrane protein MurJ [Anaerolineae bacterium]
MNQPTAEPQQAVHSQVARSVAVVAFLLAADKLLGVVREAVVSRAFGTSAELDAYIAAFEIPEGLNVIVTGAALTTALIPLLSGIVARGDRDSVWRLFSAVVNWVLAIVGGFSVVAALLARPIILTVAPGFADDPAQVTLATQLMRLVLVQTLVFSASTAITSVIQAHRSFLLPALAPICYTVGRIIGVVVLAPRMGIFGLAWGGLAGTVLHLLIKLPWLVYHRARWMLVLFHPDLAKLLKLMGPRMLGMGATYISFVLPTTFGSFLLTGAIASYEYAWKLMQLPEVVIGTAIGIVVFPTLASIADEGNREALRRTFSWALRLILTLCIPAAVGLLVLGRPLTALVLQRGAFDATATERVYWALQFFALGLITHSVLEVVARLFYAQQDMWTPLWAALAGLAVNAGLGWLLLPELAHGAIALSNSLGAGIQVVILLLVARWRLRGIDGRALGRVLLRAAVASAVMGAAVIGFSALISGAGQGVIQSLERFVVTIGLSRLQSYVELGVRGVGGGLVGCVVYAVAALLLGSQELRELPGLLVGRRQAA